MYDIILKNCSIVNENQIKESDIAIKNQRIDLISSSIDSEAKKVIDLNGRYVIPGLIDDQVHFREPGLTHKGDIATESKAGLAGGVTSFFEMPNVNPPTGTAETLRQKHQLAAEKAHVDFGIYGLLSEENLEDLPDLIAGGIIGFKCFMGNTFGDLPAPSTGAMLEGFEYVAQHGYRIALHAETASIMARRQLRLEAAGRTDPLAHLAARPAVVAIEAVGRAAAVSYTHLTLPTICSV